MAVATSSSRAALAKAVVLPLILVLLAVAAGASSGASSMEDGPAVAKSGGRFSETPAGRKLLQFIKLCGAGSAPNFSCKTLLPLAKNATCCTDFFGNQACFDLGSDATHCGKCTTSCKLGSVCCSGVCKNLLTDKNNCGFCGRVCKGPLPTCILGFCNY